MFCFVCFHSTKFLNLPTNNLSFTSHEVRFVFIFKDLFYIFLKYFCRFEVCLTLNWWLHVTSWWWTKTIELHPYTLAICLLLFLVFFSLNHLFLQMTVVTYDRDPFLWYRGSQGSIVLVFRVPSINDMARRGLSNF